mmetsp:Transcript_17243/g.37231  ORF Transcript_17243/g.37231 Transcript_17243/m.37231 type:complete len:85 (-) Transcript_17243:703-957(-)
MFGTMDEHHSVTRSTAGAYDGRDCSSLELYATSSCSIKAREWGRVQRYLLVQRNEILLFDNEQRVDGAPNTELLQQIIQICLTD